MRSLEPVTFPGSCTREILKARANVSHAREAAPIRFTMLVLAATLLAVVGSFAAEPVSAADACSSATDGTCAGYVLCVGPHRDATGQVRYCDTAVFAP